MAKIYVAGLEARYASSGSGQGGGNRRHANGGTYTLGVGARCGARRIARAEVAAVAALHHEVVCSRFGDNLDSGGALIALGVHKSLGGGLRPRLVQLQNFFDLKSLVMS
jgi:hypothetical protein